MEMISTRTPVESSHGSGGSTGNGRVTSRTHVELSAMEVVPLNILVETLHILIYAPAVE